MKSEPGRGTAVTLLFPRSRGLHTDAVPTDLPAAGSA
jgi:hypothetical protein